MKTQKQIEQLAQEWFLNDTLLAYGEEFGFIQGYNQCQKDMADKKYTEKDMRKVFEYGKTLEPFDCFEDFIKSLNKQD